LPEWLFMDNEFTPKIWKKQDTILIRLPYNDLDAHASEHFKGMVEDIIAAYTFKCLILDFSDVVLLDGTGLASIVYTLNVCSANGIKLILATLRPNIVEMIAKKGIPALLEIFGTVHDALDAATKYTSIDELSNKSLKSMENVFGNPFEEDIKY